jgi:radical SAM protein with 4Fe4S-binding SPASM domain
MSSCHSKAPNFEFGRDLIEDALNNKRLLSIEIEFSRKCNFKCPYCYVPGFDYSYDELSVDQIRDVIVQAQGLGARKIIILGGEPMVYPGIFDHLKFIRDLGLEADMFTNGCNIDQENAKKLFDNRVNVILKMNTFDEGLQDKLAGVKGAYRIIQSALENLKSAGYSSQDSPLLAVSTIVCKQNIKEMPQLWKWLRDQNILPYIEMITPQGNALSNDWLDVESKNLEKLFDEIAEIDRESYGQDWKPQPPLISNACLRHGFSCLVSSNGDVMPCVGIPIVVGNTRESSLKSIIEDSEVIQDLRNFKKTIKGPCSTCEKAGECYGCRGAAYNLTGDYLASDPMCWRNIGREKEIGSLPTPADNLIPHQDEMRVIDTLESIGERTATTRVRIRETMPFVDEQGALDECVYMEMMAQSIAAMSGFKNNGNSKVKKGLLLGAKKLDVIGAARVNDVLEVTVFKAAKFDGFGIIEGKITRNKAVIARGEIKVWEST